MKALKFAAGLLLMAIGIIGLIAVGYYVGYDVAKDRQLANPLTPDSREFLHGYKLDLPEELTGDDTTHLLGIKDSVNHIYQIIIP